MCAWNDWVALLIMFFVAGFAGAGVTVLLYELNNLGAKRRSTSLQRISQLDLFELPESMRPPKSDNDTK